MASFCRVAHFRRVIKTLITEKSGSVFKNQISLNFIKCEHFTTATCLYKKPVDATEGDLDRLEHLRDDGVSLDVIEKEIEKLKQQQNRLDGKKVGSKKTPDNVLHVPVMKQEVLEHLAHTKDSVILDMTFGAGGHSKAILDAVPGCHILALDRDPTAYKLAHDLARERPGKVTPLLGRFSELSHLLKKHNIQPGSVGGALMDLGSSSMQFDQSERGFSLSKDAPLDMRMDGERFPDQPTAADVVNHLDVVDLARILRKYGDERRAKLIAQGIVEARSAFGRISSTQQLADIVESVCGGAYGMDKLGRRSHTATKTFQALRIFVNNEMNELNFGLKQLNHYLYVGGICVTISFHSLEDRIIKRHFHDIDLYEGNNLTLSQKQKIMGGQSLDPEVASILSKKWEPVNKKVIMPSEEEVESNPRSRSAKLRAARKCESS